MTTKEETLPPGFVRLNVQGCGWIVHARDVRLFLMPNGGCNVALVGDNDNVPRSLYEPVEDVLSRMSDALGAARALLATTGENYA